MAMSENQVALVNAAKAGDVNNFEQLYHLYYGKIYGFARMILSNSSDAEDVLQETFITAWQKLDTLKESATFTVWLQVIARNLCYMQLRRKHPEVSIDAQEEAMDFLADDSLEALPAVYCERADLREVLGKIINNLSQEQRQTVVLHYFNEFSLVEVAEIMECSVGTVKSRLFLARKAIKAEIEEKERKSGEKFYGIAGVAVLPFIKMIKAYMEPYGLSQVAMETSFNIISETISQLSSAAQVSNVTNEITNKITEEAKMLKNLSTTTKIITGLTALATVGAAIALTIILTTGGSKTSNLELDDQNSEITENEDFGDKEEDNEKSNSSSGSTSNSANVLSDSPTLSKHLPKLSGYYAVEDKDYGWFIKFFDDKGSPSIEFGGFRSDFWEKAKIISVTDNGSDKVTLVIAVPKNTGQLSPHPAYEEIFELDFGDFTSSSSFKVRSDAFDGTWQKFKYGGKTIEQAEGGRYD